MELPSLWFVDLQDNPIDCTEQAAIIESFRAELYAVYDDCPYP